MHHNKTIVLIGTTGASFYGFRADLIKRLVQDKHVVYAFTSEYTNQCLEKISALGARPVTYQLSRGGLNPFSDLMALRQLVQKLKQIKADIVFSYFAKPVIYGSIAAKWAKVPVVIGMLEGLGYTFTEQPNGQTLKTRIVRNVQLLLYRLALPQLDHMIFLNRDDQQDLLEQHHIHVAQSHILGGIGLDLSQYPYREAPIEPIRFLFIGRLLKEKGIFEFIDAIRLVKSQYPNAQFTVLGAIDHANMGALKQHVLDQLIDDKLFDYPGYVTDVQSWISASSVFVLPSYREGIPRSTQEAMAMGRPVITTDVPGCRETVVDGVNGFLIPKWDAQALAERMCFFIKNPEKVNQMGSESYKIALRSYDVRDVNEKLLGIMGVSD